MDDRRWYTMCGSLVSFLHIVYVIADLYRGLFTQDETNRIKKPETKSWGNTQSTFPGYTGDRLTIALTVCTAVDSAGAQGWWVKDVSLYLETPTDHYSNTLFLKIMKLFSSTIHHSVKLEKPQGQVWIVAPVIVPDMLKLNAVTCNVLYKK